MTVNVKVGVKGLPVAVAGSNGLLGREVVRVFKKRIRYR